MDGNRERRAAGSRGTTAAEHGGPAGQAAEVSCPSCDRRNRVPAAGPGVPHCGHCGHELPWLTSAGDDDYDEVVTRSEVPVLIDLWASWCSPCRIVVPGVEQAARTLAGRLKVVKVDVDAAPRVANRFGIQAVPTLLVLDRGRTVARQAGALAPKALVRWVEQAIANRAA
jgi:thioredoxin 2